MTLAKTGSMQLSKSLEVELQPLIERHGWRELIEKRRFEPLKAVQAVKCINPDYLTQKAPKTVEMALKSEAASLATVKKYMGEVKMMAALHHLLYQVTKFFNVGKGANDDMIEMVSRLIFDEYYYLTIDELKFCFRCAMLGKYGQLYDRLDGGVILQWVSKYVDERFRIKQQMNEIERASHESFEGAAVPMPEWFSGWLSQYGKETKTTITVDQVLSDQNMKTYYEKTYHDSDAAKKGVPFNTWLIFEVEKL